MGGCQDPSEHHRPQGKDLFEVPRFLKQRTLITYARPQPNFFPCYISPQKFNPRIKLDNLEDPFVQGKTELWRIGHVSSPQRHWKKHPPASTMVHIGSPSLSKGGHLPKPLQSTVALHVGADRWCAKAPGCELSGFIVVDALSTRASCDRRRASKREGRR